MRMPSFKIIDFRFWRRFLKVFTIHGGGCHLGHVTWTIYTNFCSTSQGGSTLNLALIGQAISEKKIFENGGRTNASLMGFVL